MSYKNVVEIMELFSSPAKKVHIPPGSVWCDNCRKNLHTKMCERYSEVLTKYQCDVCCG